MSRSLNRAALFGVVLAVAEITFGQTVEQGSRTEPPYFISVKDFHAAGDGLTNDTANVQAALNAAQSGTAVYFPPGSYAICSVSTAGKALTITGSGMMTSVLVRHSSCLQAHTNMMNITSASVVIRDIGLDMRTDGSYLGNSIINIGGASNVDIGDSYFAHAQAVGIQISRSDNVRIHGNHFKEDWWFGVSLASGGTTASPVYNRGFTVTGNVFENTPIGLGFSFFLRDIAVTGNVFLQSNLSLVQMPHAYADVSGNTFDGSASYGCAASCGLASYIPAIFLEGVGDYVIGSNNIHRPSGSGILCQGSTLTIPSGGIAMQLPCSRGSIHGNVVDSVEPQQPILVSAASTDGAPGSQILIQNNEIQNSSSCITVAGARSIDETNNQCDSTTVAGYFLSGVTRSRFRGNDARNISTTSGNFSGLEINGASQDIDVDQNTFSCEAGMAHCMRFGVHDVTLEGGGASQVRHCGNTIRGATKALWFPLPIVPLSGKWSLNDCIENFPTTVPGKTQSASNQPLEWRNTNPGVPGNWVPVGLAIPPSCITVSSPALCGNSTLGSVAIPPGQSSLQVNSTSVGATSQIFIQEDPSLGLLLKLNCAFSASTLPYVSFRDASRSFTIGLGVAPASHFGCYSFRIENTR